MPLSLDTIYHAGQRGVIDTAAAVDAGVAAVATRPERRDLVHLQRMANHRDLIAASSEHGLPVSDLLAAQAMLGTRDLTGVSTDAISAAATAARQVQHTTVAIVYDSKNRMANLSPLMDEIAMRGSTPVLLRGNDLEMRDGQLYHQGRAIATPDAVIPRSTAAPVLKDLEAAGAYIVNPRDARRAGASKSSMAAMYQANDIPHPATRPGLTSAAQVNAAAKELGFPLVVKVDRSAGGLGVFKADDQAELDALNEKLLGTPGSQPVVAQQFFKEAGARDLRLVMVRDAHGVPQPVSAYHRFAAKDDFRAVGAQATVLRAPLTGDDTGYGVTPEDVETGRKVAYASGLDVVGVDLMGPAGNRVVTEHNPMPGIPEIDLPLPYSEHTLPRIADNAVWGSHTTH